MRRRTPLLAGAVLVAALLAGGPSAPAKQAGSWPGWKAYEQNYLDTYEQCWDKLASQCGRNIVDDGYRMASGKVREPREGEVKQATSRLDLAVNPPVQAAPPPTEEQPEVVTQVAPSTAVPAPVSSSGGCPASMSGEASSPAAVNPESGASGCYQVIPSTQRAMGAACSDVNAPSCLAAICSAQGNGAWDASGSTPC